MQRCGFAAKGLFVMDGSKRSAHANAYFTGFGAAKRVVFYDTLLAKLSPGEVDAVLAHELGHFKHKHIIKRIVSLFAMSLAGFALLGWLSGRPGSTPAWACAQHGRAQRRAGAAAVHAGRAGVQLLHLAPVRAAVAQARVRGRRLRRGRPAARPEHGLLKLYEDNASTLTPDPVFVKFYYSHPPASERLACRMTHA
jgi:STE24 endopeptidase